MDNLQAQGSASPADLTSQLARIDQALAGGEVETARRLAEVLLERGRSEPAGPGDASARLRMGYCDLAASRVKRARDGARSAVAKFRQAAATSDEIDALSLLSRAATQLGRSVEAVEAGAMAVRLSDEVPRGRWTARAHLSLAIAYAWGGAAAQADRAFEAARQAAHLHADVAGQLEVSVERLWGQLLRWARERQGQDIAPVFGTVSEVATLQRGWEDAPDAEPLTPGSRHGLRASVMLAQGLASLWSNGIDAVRCELSQLDSELDPSDMPGWMLAALSWLRAEVAVQEGQFEPAAMYASRMTDWARDAGNLPLASLGSALATSICIRQGRFELALAEQAKGLADERAMGAHHLDGRSELVESQWAARRSESRINDLAAEARKYEAWALQDALTGIANRRQLTLCLEAWSAQAVDSREPLCAALIDVDRFKSINDNFSHHVGDEVLTTIARKMVDHIREADLAARWGGDEFAILFRNTDVATAGAISERIEQSVRAHDWSLVAPELTVSVSVGVVEAQPGDNKHSLVDRSDKAMYARKRARAQAELTRTLSPVLVQQMTAWLKRAKRVAFFVGSGTGDGADPASLDNLAAWETGKRAAFGHVSGLLNHPGEFEKFWRQWRIDRRSRQPLSMHQAAVKLSHLLPEALFVTERVDGILPMAGADNVIELYGNAFRNRCNACGRVWPSSDNGRCIACSSPARTIRPDIVLLGEEPDIRLLAGAELFIKRANVVFVLDCDATTFPGAGLLEKARTRGAHVIMLGSGSRTHRGMADVSVPSAPEAVLNALSEALAAPGEGGVAGSALSAEGFAMLAFLSGHGTDSQGNSLDQALKWSNYEIAAHQATIPWMFPLLTRSKTNPMAPMPTRDDFRELAKDEHVRSGVRKAFLLMLRFYGFHWADGRVEKGQSWQQGFATWALQPSYHDLFISRVLGSATLFGLETEARAFLQALEPEVLHHRGQGAAVPLRHWRLAVQGPVVRVAACPEAS